MTKKYILHIETTPLPKEELVKRAPVFKAAGNLKDAVKIAEDIEKKKNKFFEEAAFNENTATISAFALYDLENNDTFCVFKQGAFLVHTHGAHGAALELVEYSTVTEPSDAELEKALLVELFEKLSGDTHTITFRGLRYVYPFIARRGAFHNINFFELFASPNTGGLYVAHTDLAKIWAFGGISHPEHLEELTSVLGVDFTPPSAPLYQLLETEEEHKITAVNDYINRILKPLTDVYYKIKC